MRHLPSHRVKQGGSLPMEHSKASIIEQALAVLEQAGAYLAVHELGNILRARGVYANDNNLATQLFILTREKRAVARYREGCKYKEWRAASAKPEQLPLPLTGVAL